MITVNKVAGSIEKIDASVTAATSLDGIAVEIALVAAGAAPTWLAADWTATPTTTGTARTDAAQTLAEGTYTVRARLTATPETPIVDCYILNVHP